MNSTLSLILVIIAGLLVAVIIPLSIPQLAQLTATTITTEIIEPTWINDTNTTVTEPIWVNNTTAAGGPRGR